MSDSGDHVGDNPLLKVKMRRRPTTASTQQPDEALRRQLEHEIEKEVALYGKPLEAFRFYLDGEVEEYDLGERGDPETEPALAAMFARLGQREDVVRRFRLGELALPSEEGRRRRAACLLEIVSLSGDRLPDRWWLAARHIGQGEAGIGVMHGDWTESEGEGVDDLPEALQAWVTDDPERLESIALREQARKAPVPFVRAAVGQLQVPLPEDAMGVARIAGELTLKDATAGPLNHMVVLVFRGEDYERWEVREKLPCSPDDLVRAIAAYSQAEAVGLVHPGVVNIDSPEGQTERRAVVSRVERDGRVALHLQTLHVAQDGTISAAEAFLQDGGEAGDDGWIGVPPTVEVNINMPPPPGAPTWGPVGEG